jgi:hypothetical protein
MEYFDITYYPDTKKTDIALEGNTTVALKDGMPIVKLMQGQDLVILSKQALLDLADYIRSQEGTTWL